MIMKLGVNFFPNTEGGDKMETKPNTIIVSEEREKKKMVAKLKQMQFMWIPMSRMSDEEIDALAKKPEEFIRQYKMHEELWAGMNKKPKAPEICKACKFEISKKEVDLCEELSELCFKCFCKETEQEYSWF